MAITLISGGFQLGQTAGGGVGIGEPREEIALVVKGFGDARGEFRQALGIAHDVEHEGRRRLEQHVGPAHHPLRIIPELIEGGLHPNGIKRAVAMVQDALQVDRGGFGGVVGTLPGDRIVQADRIGEAQNLAFTG